MENPILIFLAIAIAIIVVAILISKLMSNKQSTKLQGDKDRLRNEGRSLAVLAALTRRKRK